MIHILLAILLIGCIALSFAYINLKQGLVKLRQAVTEKRQSETNLRLTNPVSDRELASLIAEMNEVFDEMQEVKIISAQEKKTLDLAIHNITHDIRTPLTIASGYTQKLLKDYSELEEEAKASTGKTPLPALEKIQDNLKTVSERLETLLEYQNLMETNVQPSFSAVDFSQFVTAQLLSYYDTLKEKQIDVAISIEPNIFIQNDPDILQRILQNLFGNVIKHGKEKLEAALDKSDKSAILTLKNRSQQPITSIDRLTTRFYSENMSETEKSSGLGLYVVKELVELTNGYLEMSYGDSWFTIQIFFPLTID